LLGSASEHRIDILVTNSALDVVADAHRLWQPVSLGSSIRHHDLIAHSR
jgi:hypothetical protein